MSWGKSYTSLQEFRDDDFKRPGNFAADPSHPEVADKVDTTHPLDQEDHIQEQIQLAKKLVEEVISSGVVGKEGKDYSIHMGGHSSKGRDSHDSISISVNQR